MPRPSKKRYRNGNKEQNRRNQLIDELEAFSNFKDEILPVLRNAVAGGMTSEEIYKKFQAYAAARIVSIAAMEIDSSKALAAAKDIMDRAGGRATEKQEVTHKFDAVPDDQLDALIKSKLQQEGASLSSILKESSPAEVDEDEVDVLQ